MLIFFKLMTVSSCPVGCASTTFRQGSTSAGNRTEITEFSHSCGWILPLKEQSGCVYISIPLAKPLSKRKTKQKTWQENKVQSGKAFITTEIPGASNKARWY